MSPSLNIPEIARTSAEGRARVIGPDDIFPTEGHSHPQGIIRGTAEDLLYTPVEIANMAMRFVRHAIKNAVNGFTPIPLDPSINAAFLATGHLGHNDYLARIAEKLHWPSIYHPDFDTPKARGRMLSDANKYTEFILQRQAPILAIGHSKAGPRLVKTLKNLQDLGESDKVPAVILFSPIINGVRDEIAPIASWIPSNTIREMCPESGALKQIQEAARGLTPENRRKIVTIIPEDGDQFASPKRAHIPGTTMLLTDGDGHLQQCMDPNCISFQLAIEIANTIMRTDS